jgi:hypothetical protein
MDQPEEVNPPNKFLSDFLAEEVKSLLDNTNSHIWKWKPVPFHEFLTDHLKITLTDRQMQDVVTFLGVDSEMVFNGGTPYNLFCLLAGKGSGKDWLSSVVTCYLFYILLCLKDPKEYFGFPPSEAIDILIISFTAEQAKDVSFDKVKQFFKHWMWLRQNFSIIEGDRITSGKGKPEIIVLNDRIKTWNNIRIIAEHSANESFEGYNVLYFLMSEASAFRGANKTQNGWKVFNTLRASASSRFPGRWKGIVASFPRYDENSDFTFQLYTQAETDPTIFRDLVWPWQFKPMRYYKGVFFDFEGIQVPIEYQSDAESDPPAFRKMVLCKVPKVGESVINDEAIIKSVHPYKPLINLVTTIRKNEDGLEKVVGNWEGLDIFKSAPYEYLVTVDLGELTSATAVAISHVHTEKDHLVYVLDYVGAWTPDPKKGISVDMGDVKDRLFELAAAIPGVRVGFDQWQSILYASELNKRGIKTIKYHVHQDRDYETFRKAMGMGNVKILDDVELILQFNAIKKEGAKVYLDTKISPRKDLVDVTVGGYMILMGEQPEDKVGIPGATYITGNLDRQGGTMLWK